MGVKLTQSNTHKALDYDKLHMLRLNIRQEHRDLETDPPMYTVFITYRTYGVDAQGARHYSGDGIKTIRIKDYLKEAAGDPTKLMALGAIEQAFAAVVADTLGIDTEVF